MAKSDEWGSPHLKDPTARLERLANEVTERLHRAQETLVPNIINRPPGSQKVPREDMLREFRAMGGDSGFLMQRLEELIQQHGQVEGREQYAKWVEDMRSG